MTACYRHHLHRRGGVEIARAASRVHPRERAWMVSLGGGCPARRWQQSPQSRDMEMQSWLISMLSREKWTLCGEGFDLDTLNERKTDGTTKRDKNECGTPLEEGFVSVKEPAHFAYYLKCTCIACRRFVSKVSLPKKFRCQKGAGVHMYALHITCPQRHVACFLCLFSTSLRCIFLFDPCFHFFFSPFASIDRIRV